MNDEVFLFPETPANQLKQKQNISMFVKVNNMRKLKNLLKPLNIELFENRAKTEEWNLNN